MSNPCLVHQTPPKNFKPTVHVAGCLLCSEGRFLLLERHPKKPQGKTWGIPSGKLEKGELPLEALLREVDEEVSVRLKFSEIKEIGTLYVQHPDLHFCYHLFYVKRKKQPRIHLNLDEHLEAKWVTLEEALKMPLIGGGADALHYGLDSAPAIKSAFSTAGNGQIAEWQTSYMRSQFPFLGIPKPLRSQLQKAVYTRHPLLSEQHLMETVATLFNMNEREFQYAALDLLMHARSYWTEALLPFLKILLLQKSWWDTVDTIAVQGVGNLLMRYPALQNEMDLWIEHENLWIRRTALLHQLNWKEKTDQTRLFDYCQRQSQEKDFFIRKAIGWALRQYAKIAPKDVIQFLKKTSFSPLTVREATKHLKKKSFS